MFAQVYNFNVPTFGPGVIFDVERKIRTEQIKFFSEALKKERVMKYAPQFVAEAEVRVVSVALAFPCSGCLSYFGSPFSGHVSEYLHASHHPREVNIMFSILQTGCLSTTSVIYRQHAEVLEHSDLTFFPTWSELNPK